MGQHGVTFPDCARPRDRRPRDREWAARSRSSGGDLAAVGCMVDSCRDCAELQARASSSTATTCPTFTYNSPDKHSRRRHLRRLLREHRRRRSASSLRVPHEARPRRRRAAAVRRHHHLFAAAPLEGRPRPEGRHRRPRRARPHGREVRPRVRRPRRAVHHLARQGRGRPAARRRRGRGLHERRRDGRSTPSSFDFILDAVSADHDINAYLELLKLDGTLCLVGAPETAAARRRLST